MALEHIMARVRVSLRRLDKAAFFLERKTVKQRELSQDYLN